MVSSESEGKDRELKHTLTAMRLNGYPRRFVEKAISRQARHREQKTLQPDDQDKMMRERIPFIDGLSQEVQRLACMVEVKCSFYMSSTLRGTYCAIHMLCTH